MTYCNQEFDAHVLHAAQRALRHSLDPGSGVWHADYRARFERFGDCYVRPLVTGTGAHLRLAAAYVTCVDTNWRVIPTLRLLEAVAATDADAVVRVLDLDGPIPRSLIALRDDVPGWVFVRNKQGKLSLQPANDACDAAGGGFVVRTHWDPALGAYLVDTSQGKR